MTLLIRQKEIKLFKRLEINRFLEDKIADLVRQSHEARRKSKELLEQAKKEVEAMIEKYSNT